MVASGEYFILLPRVSVRIAIGALRPGVKRASLASVGWLLAVTLVTCRVRLVAKRVVTPENE